MDSTRSAPAGDVRLPAGAKVVVIGAGIHGLSTAWHLARQLRRLGRGDGRDVIVLDKTGIGAGPSGLACGVIRNNYFQSSMRELMAHSVSIWESDPETFHYHPVGYMQIAPEVMHADVATIYEEQRAIGYPSVLVEGKEDCQRYMEGIFYDWQAKNITVVLHEMKGGYAHNLPALIGLADKARAEGVRILYPVRVVGFREREGAIDAVETDRGAVRCDHVVVAAGPWVRDIWAMLDLPPRVQIRRADGTIVEEPMWTYWCLEEGVLGVDPDFLTDNQGRMPPVIHVDTDAPLYDDVDGSLITDRLWGIYYKPDFHFDGVQGGTVPWKVERPAEEVPVDPYGPDSEEFVVGERFERLWTSGLAHCQKRFEGKRHLYRRARTGGIGAFTPDSFPVFDVFRENVYVIADSNHGYKMIGVGELVAKEMMGQRQPLLEPFRFNRFEEGRLHPVSHSPFPWS